MTERECIINQDSNLLDITSPANFQRAVENLLADLPVAMEVWGSQGIIFGFFGTAKAYIKGEPNQGVPSICKIKTWSGGQRNFYEKPPVMLVTWEKLEEFVDWQKLASYELGIDKERAKGLIENITAKGSGHLVLPIRAEWKPRLPFTLPFDNGDDGQAFMRVMSGPLQTIVLATQNQEPIYATSANLSGKRTITSLDEFLETFPNHPLTLIYPREDREVVPGKSSSMYDFTKFPELISVLRLRGGPDHQTFIRTLVSLNLQPEIDFLRLDEIL